MNEAPQGTASIHIANHTMSLRPYNICNTLHNLYLMALLLQPIINISWCSTLYQPPPFHDLDQVAFSLHSADESASIWNILFLFAQILAEFCQHSLIYFINTVIARWAELITYLKVLKKTWHGVERVAWAWKRSVILKLLETMSPLQTL